MEYGLHGKRQMFNGKLYRALVWCNTKAEAQKRAKAVRSRGLLARVVPQRRGYDVYIRG